MRSILLAAGCVLLLAAPVMAGSIKVSSNGVDSGTCGSGPNPPCATLSQAVTNAAAGDSILVGPGRYAGTAVSKKLKLWSSAGSGAAVINSTITLAASGIVFGKPGKGFSVSPGSGNNAVVVTSSDITVRGNWITSCFDGVRSLAANTIVRDNTIEGCNRAIDIVSTGALVRRNRIAYPNNYGVMLEATSSAADVRENQIHGPSGTAIGLGGGTHLVRRNLVQGTGAGFGSPDAPVDATLLENLVIGTTSIGYNVTSGGDMAVTKNAVIGTGGPGFYFSATGATYAFNANTAIGNPSYGIIIINGGTHTLIDNTAIHNQYGILLSGIPTGITVAGGNVYGNTSNCGVSNASLSTLTVDGVYWGDPLGPGADPADGLCDNTAAITVTDPATKAAKINMPPVK